MKLIFATSNPNKTAEIKKALPDEYTILSLVDIDKKISSIAIDEPYNTLQENAIHKAISYQKISGLNCFSEDTGLEVDALEGRPGVHSARYAGIHSNDKKNIEKLLLELRGTSQRNARFRTVIALIINEKQYVFEGICDGEISEFPTGENGFGYDPVFIPKGSNKSFAEMTIEEKNKYSHRKKAIAKMIDFLKENKSIKKN
jgi:XTP/dITP diphosphohydrolase